MPARKRPYHHGDLRRTLLEASLELITERGLDALSLREVARRAGVSPGAPYHHFATREQLLVALAVEGFGLLTLAMQSARDAAAKSDAIDRLAVIGEAYVRFALAHPAHFRLMFRPSLVAPSAMPEEGAPAQAFAVLVHAVAEVLADDAVRERIAERELVVMCWSIVHGASELLLEGPLAQGLPQMDVRASDVPALVTHAFARAIGMLATARETPSKKAAARKTPAKKAAAKKTAARRRR